MPRVAPLRRYTSRLRRAMTLPEVMVSFAVFTLSAAGVYAAFAASMYRNKAAIAATTASNYAAAVCSQLRVTTYSALESLLNIQPGQTPTQPNLSDFSKTEGASSPLVWYRDAQRTNRGLSLIPVSVIKPDGTDGTAPGAPVNSVYVPIDADTVLRNRTLKTISGTTAVSATAAKFEQTPTLTAQLFIRLTFVNGRDLTIPALKAGSPPISLPGRTAAGAPLKYIRVDVMVSAPFGIGGISPAPVYASTIITPTLTGGAAVTNG